MEVFTKSLILALTLASALAQYEGYDFDQHGLFQPPYHKQPAHQTLDLHGHEELEYHGHQHYKHEDHDLDYHAHPKYAFDYSVKDPHTGDDKEHWETRDGDKVKGSYTLTETDGTKRVVEYEADDKNGFNAVVHKIGTPKEHPAEHKRPLFEVNHGHGYEPLRFHNEPQHELSHFDEGFQPFVPNGYH